MVTTGLSGKIHVLPGDVISRIAAGEVIERPAAVVKELIENSLDAGSRTIAVDVKDGGMAMIRVTDDGEGMTRTDVPQAFERHATSKLRSDRDLWSIRTMGFRGEALPSIASVSKVRLVTATKLDAVGTDLHLAGGRIQQVLDAPPVVGTRIEVTELFYNQPARKKFLKSMPTECSHITHVVQQAALAWPSVHFKLTSNGQEVLNCPAVSTAKDRIGQIYRRLFLDHAVAVQGEQPGAAISGLIIDANHAKASRTPQELFVNSRPVRNAAILHAVAEGYGSFLPKGHQPQFVLFLEIDPDGVDVNVHPAKREIRFAATEAIHQLVRRAVRQALGRSEGASSHPHDTVRERGAVEPAGIPSWSQGVSVGTPGAALQVGSGGSAESIPRVEQLAFVSEAAEPYVRVPSSEVVALGQLNRTYLVVQLGGALTIVDQHTAHERVLFERLYRAWQSRGMSSQPLLIPESVELTAPQAALLQRYQGDLEQLGLGLEPFGPATVLVRSVPLGIGKVDAGAFLQDVLDDLSQWDRASSLEDRVRPVLASLACHGAVRAGRAMELPEIKHLAEDWLAEGKIQTCPHGRRTVFHLGAEELEKIFGRVGWKGDGSV
ncbi:DNA mismatch repair endonuclease MutL [Nitrospira sp. NS4]|uniref:DNA mismatch repair endonuclease MutL n=1 Tax=Nitrospira sp. NS4 TaxID=3414498 RepID=UPI003C2D2CEE